VSRVITLLSAPLVIGYPVVVYYSLQHYSARGAALVLLVGLTPMVWRFARARTAIAATRSASGAASSRRSWAALGPIAAVVLVLAASLTNSVRSLLLVPICINGALLLSFGLTLFEERSLIERFARLQHDDLTPRERRWCRTWTLIWSSFFAFNIVLAVLFAATQSLAWWTFYNGLLAYVVMGLLFATEYIVRKYRFQRFDNHGLDRVLRWSFLKLGLLQ
jgi:uncharacterized membrane protein